MIQVSIHLHLFVRGRHRRVRAKLADEQLVGRRAWL